MDGTWALLLTAAGIGFFHTLIGVDHSVPFVVLAREKQWPLRQTLGITLLCGIMHVGASVLLGFVGIGLGHSADELGLFDSFRGRLASFTLIGFGLAYAAYGLYRSWAGRPHRHFHANADGSLSSHVHTHGGSHSHSDRGTRNRTGYRPRSRVTLAALLLIFVLGPCEALIPLMLAPAAAGQTSLLLSIVVVFGFSTVLAMVLAVSVGLYGVGALRFRFFERHLTTFAGLAIALSGASVELFGI